MKISELDKQDYYLHLNNIYLSNSPSVVFLFFYIITQVFLSSLPPERYLATNVCPRKEDDDKKGLKEIS